MPEQHHVAGDNVRLVVSSDGSHTLFATALNEHYHSTHGAVQESEHIFIQAGLQEAVRIKDRISLLEVGFGTGLNVLLSCLEAERRGLTVRYTAIDTYPLPEETWSQINYGRFLDQPEAEDLYRAICSSGWDRPASINSNFSLHKRHISLQELEVEAGEFELIYFDAFSPETQPELWTEEIFTRLNASLAPGGILVTYCCKGTVKRAMKAAGFSIEKLPGPPGKREILRARKAG